MARAFDSGFSRGFGFSNHGGQLLLIVGQHNTYEDGDILVAKNRRSIRFTHAQYICWPRVGGNPANPKVGGELGDTQPLLQIMLEQIYQYKFEHQPGNTALRTDLATLEQDLITMDNEDPKLCGDTDLYIQRRIKAGKKPIFGTPGSYFYYGGRTNASHAKLDTIWQEIESRTAEREENYTLWPFSPLERRHFLPISVDDFDDATGGELTSTLQDETDPENPVMVKKRKNNITGWRDLRDVNPTDALNKNLEFDVRDIRKHVRSEIVTVKELP